MEQTIPRTKIQEKETQEKGINNRIEKILQLYHAMSKNS